MAHSLAADSEALRGMREMFEQLDTDGNGLISHADMVEVRDKAPTLDSGSNTVLRRLLEPRLRLPRLLCAFCRCCSQGRSTSAPAKWSA